MVMVQAYGSVAGSGMWIRGNVNGVWLPAQVDYIINTAGYHVATSFLVPPGHTYLVSAGQSAGSPIINGWTELR